MTNRSTASAKRCGCSNRSKRSRVAASYYRSALRHAAIIERFGRFPHRNALLGRASTEEEVAFLRKPGSSF